VNNNTVFRELIADHAADAAQARELVWVLRHQPKHLKVRPTLEYRCDGGGTGQRIGGCLLLAIYQTPRGPVVYRPGHRFSPRDALPQGIDPNTDITDAAFALEHVPVDGQVRILVACSRRVLHLWPAQIRADVRAAGQRRSRPIILPNGGEAMIYR
jgi:hypothetical protein